MKTVEELEKLAILIIIEELKDGSTMTSMRMMAILNDVRTKEKLQPKKNCSTNRQKFVDIVRRVLGTNLSEQVNYSGWGEGRKPTKFSVTNYEEAKSSVMEYFSKTAEKKWKSSNGQKKEAISKILSILQKIEETSDCTIKLDLLKKLIDTKSPVNTTMRNWEAMLEKEGIILKFKAERGTYRFEPENIKVVKQKVETLYGKLADEKPVKVRVPKVSIPEKEDKELTEDEEKVVYLLTKIVDHKPVQYSQIWTALKKQGVNAGFDFMNLIRRAGLKKWFTASKKSVPGGTENCLEFTGDIQAVASLMGQETEKTYLIRSSLDETQMKTYMKSSSFKLLNAKPGDNFYELRCSDKESKVRVALLSMGFRGYDGFLYEEDAREINELKDQILESYLSEE